MYDSSVSATKPVLRPFFKFTTDVPLADDAGEDVVTWLTDGTVDVRVYSDACAASQGEVEQNITDVTGPLGDPDCIVDMYDFAVLASEWLNNVTLQ